MAVLSRNNETTATTVGFSFITSVASAYFTSNYVALVLADVAVFRRRTRRQNESVFYSILDDSSPSLSVGFGAVSGPAMTSAAKGQVRDQKSRPSPGQR